MKNVIILAEITCLFKSHKEVSRKLDTSLELIINLLQIGSEQSERANAGWTEKRYPNRFETNQ